jgi:hypothetical protein
VWLVSVKPHPGAIEPEHRITCDMEPHVSASYVYRYNTRGIGNERRRSASPPACSGPHGHSIDVVLLRHAPSAGMRLS